MSIDRAKLRKILLGESKAKRTGKAGSTTRLSGAHPARFLNGAFVAMVIVGFVGGAHSLTSSATATEPVTAAPATTTPTVDIGAGGFAELYVATWLSITRDNARALAPFYAGAVDVPSTTTTRFVATRTTVVDSQPTAPDYWAVTIGADVAVVDEQGQTKPVGLRYYAVGVSRDGNALAATTLPAQIPAPPTAKTAELEVDTLNTPSTEDRPITDALNGFLRALLTGNGDLDRYVASDARITPIRPAPFTEITVRALGLEPSGDRNRRTVRVEVLATNHNRTTTQTLHYSLDITRRDNRWEIAELIPAAPLVRSPR